MKRLALLTALALSWAPARGQGVAVEGSDLARIIPPSGAVVASYANAGYRLTRDGDEVVVEVEVSPLRSEAPFALPRQPGAKPFAPLARSLAAGARTRYEAVSRVLDWVSRNIEYHSERDAPQDAAAVLERRSGYCTGIARLTVALIGELGIQTREVAGYVVAEPAAAVPSGYHRWIEVFYPDRGWVFSDPLNSHHFVAATYVRLASEDLDLARGAQGVLVERRDQVGPVDLYPAAAPGVRARKNVAEQLAAALRVSVGDEAGGGAPHGLAVLERGTLRLTRVLADGRSTFVGLEPGTYTVRLLIANQPPFEQYVELPGRVRRVLHVPIPPPVLRAPGTAGAPAQPPATAAGAGARSR